MWRSNVVRLRTCSSLSASRHGQRLRWTSSLTGAGSPVSEDEFLKALGGVLDRQKWRPDSKLGFAISGGVDSMALAVMYAKAKVADQSLPTGHGFIVDHKARSNSTEEAEWVAEQLRSKLGMQATILSLTWPQDFDPSDLSRFESDARLLRYRALGNACKENNIRTLMVAHHADDLAETVLMRLTNSRWRTGLQAIRQIEWIPECYGIHGVHHSGDLGEVDIIRQKNETLAFPIENGGIQVLRPLLGLEKARLIATCESHDIPWAEDKTNQIPTLTHRNAIRHIFQQHKLPAALGRASLIGLSTRMHERIESHKAYAEQLFNQAMLKLDIQTGSLYVHLPNVSALLDRPIVTNSDRNAARNTAFFLLYRISELVSPMDSPSVGQLSTAVDTIYPALSDKSDSATDPDKNSSRRSIPEAKSFSVVNVWWRSWDKPCPFNKPPTASSYAQKSTQAKPNPMAFLVSRQPVEKQREEDLTQYFPPSYSSATGESYRFFDGRYWIRIQNRTPDTLILRAFHEEHLKYLSSGRKSHKAGDYYIRSTLSALYPKDLRRGLPVLFRRDAITGDEQLVGFPTLCAPLNRSNGQLAVSDWDVRYKEVDFGTRRQEEIVVPPLAQRALRAVNRRKTSKSEPRKEHAGKRTKQETKIHDANWKSEERGVHYTTEHFSSRGVGRQNILDSKAKHERFRKKNPRQSSNKHVEMDHSIDFDLWGKGAEIARKKREEALKDKSRNEGS